MKICIVTDFPLEEGKSRGGVESSVSFLVESITETTEHDVTIISVRSGVEKSVEKRGKYNIHWLPKTKYLPGFLGYFTFDRMKIIKEIETIGPQIVHFQGSYGRSIGYKGKYLCTTHGFAEQDASFSKLGNVKKFVLGFVENYARRICKYHILLNQYTKELKTGVFRNEIRFIPNPVRDIYFQKAKVISDTEYILFVGNISKLKNLLFSLKVINELKKRGHSHNLLVAGPITDHDYYEMCLSYIKKNDLNDLVDFIGNVNPKSLSGVYKKASCILVFSFQENSPMVVAESMASGTPCVSIKNFGMKYMISHGQNGVLVNDYNVFKTVDLMESMIFNKDSYSLLSKNAYESAIQTYHKSKVVDKTLSFYEEIIE